jgi:prephenate dehydrogenase
MFKKAAIVGIGLIGGSLALEIKKKKLAKTVVGVSRRKQNISYALKHGVIDSGSCGLSILKNSDLVVIATPVSVISGISAEIAKIIDPSECIVTDVGSTKSRIVEKLSRIFPRFVGSHPLAGSEQRGVINAKADLFANSLCILTPQINTEKEALRKITALWKKVGAKVTITSAKKHDNILAYVSHLPHVIAYSLISSMPDEFLAFGAGGLKDTTRIAASESGLWADIFEENKTNILQAIAAYSLQLRKLQQFIKNGDKRLITNFLSKAKNKRDKLE